MFYFNACVEQLQRWQIYVCRIYIILFTALFKRYRFRRRRYVSVSDKHNTQYNNVLNEYKKAFHNIHELDDVWLIIFAYTLHHHRTSENVYLSNSYTHVLS